MGKNKYNFIWYQKLLLLPILLGVFFLKLFKPKRKAVLVIKTK